MTFNYQQSFNIYSLYEIICTIVLHVSIVLHNYVIYKMIRYLCSVINCSNFLIEIL